MDIKLTEGRNFRQEDANTEHRAWIFNETARKRFNLELNAMLEGWGGGGEIVGFMPDVKLERVERRNSISESGRDVRAPSLNRCKKKYQIF